MHFNFFFLIFMRYSHDKKNTTDNCDYVKKEEKDEFIVILNFYFLLFFFPESCSRSLCVHTKKIVSCRVMWGRVTWVHYYFWILRNWILLGFIKIIVNRQTAFCHFFKSNAPDMHLLVSGDAHFQGHSQGSNRVRTQKYPLNFTSIQQKFKKKPRKISGDTPVAHFEGHSQGGLG